MGRRGDRRRAAGGDPRRRVRSRSLRHHLLRQRVRRLRRVPGRHPRRLRARPAVCHRTEEGDARGFAGALRAGGGRRTRRLCGAFARGTHRQGRAEPAALSLRAGQDARAQQAGSGRDAFAASAAAGAREARGSGGSGPARRVSRQRRRGGAGGRRDAAEGGRFVSVLVLMEDGDPSRQTLTLARKFGEPRSVRIDAILPFAPDALATALAQAADELDASAVFAAGTERGNEVMARLAARMDLPFAANCIAAAPGDPVEVTRLRWGGSLLEEARLHSPRPLITVAPHTVAIEEGPEPIDVDVARFVEELDERDLLVRASDHVAPQDGGVSLTTAKVIVSGGRGVGSKEGFAIIEELAGLLGAAVGCSRAVTSAGWRPHSDQVGQTGTKVAPEVYIACSISGATQHMAGLEGAKRILAMNSDRQAPLMLNADYTVTGDLKEIVPAISAEIRKRK